MGTKKTTPKPKVCPPMTDQEHELSLEMQGFMEHLKAKDAAQRLLKAAQAETVQIPKIEFNRQIDRLMTAQRLALALHRIGAKGDPATLLAWDIFLAVHDATDTLGIAAGIDSDELEPE